MTVQIEEGANPTPIPKTAQRVLVAIANEPGLRSPHLAERLGVSRSTIAASVAILRDAQLVTYEGSPRTGGYRPMWSADAR